MINLDYQPEKLIQANQFSTDIRNLFNQAFHSNDPNKRAYYQKLYNQELQKRQIKIISSKFLI